MVPKFTTVEVKPHETLGEKLKKIRLNLKLTYDEVEKRTKIRKKYLKAIEENNYEVLPSNVYARGFLKNYSKVLKIPSDKVLEWYEKEKGIVDNIKVGKKKNQTNYKTPKVFITPKTFVFALVGLSFLGVFSYLVYEFFIFTSPPRLEIFSPKENETINRSFVDITGKTDSGTDLFVNGQQVNISDEGEFKVTVSIAQNGLNTISILAKNPKNNKKTESTRNILADIPHVSPINENQEGDFLILSLEIGPKTSSIKIVSDGEEQFNGIMLPGSKKDFQAKESFLISTGNAGSTKIIFNGKEIGTLGDDGEFIKDFRIDKQTILNK